MKFLLDTNVISEIRRGRDENVAAWAAAWKETDLYLSALTVGEIRKGIERLRSRNPQQAQAFATWLEELRDQFSDRILPVDTRVAEDWGTLNASADRKSIDSLIAATARVHGLTVATRNTADFQDCEVRLLNPWERLPR